MEKIEILKYLETAHITEVLYIHDYLQFVTSKGDMSIYNITKYVSPELRAEIKTGFPIERILGRKIITVTHSKDEYLSFELDDGNSIIISLLPEDFVCPEAMEVWLDDGRIVVN